MMRATKLASPAGAARTAPAIRSRDVGAWQASTLLRGVPKLPSTICAAGKKGPRGSSSAGEKAGGDKAVPSVPEISKGPPVPVAAPSLSDDPVLPERPLSTSSSLTNSNGSSSSSSQPDSSAGPNAVLMNAKSGAQTSGSVEGNILWRKFVKQLASLPLAISCMAVIAGLSGLGTVLPQNKSLEFYYENYPNEGAKVLGFLTNDIILGLQLDHVYTAWYFFGSMIVLGGSLMACTYTRQWPAVKVAQRWRFQNNSSGVVKMGEAEVLPDGQLQDLGALLTKRGYQVFVKSPSLYAFKGLAGRIGPIGVHLALLLCLGGTAYSGFGTLKGSALCPEGQEFVVGEYLTDGGPLSSVPEGASTVLHVDTFKIDYRPNGQVAQYYSDLTLYDFYGRTLAQKQISVNQPFRYKGVTMYQTDWALAAVSLHVLNPELITAQEIDTSTFSLPLANLEGRAGVDGRLWGTFLPVAPPPEGSSTPKGFSFVAQDPESVVVYGSDGQFIGVRRVSSGKPLEVEGIKIVFDGVVGSTGLEIKADPGVPFVYAGFGGLMVTTVVSYLSHSQVWAVKEGRYLYVSGRSNRAKLGFSKEFDEILDLVPEVPEEVVEVKVKGVVAEPARTA